MFGGTDLISETMVKDRQGEPRRKSHHFLTKRLCLTCNRLDTTKQTVTSHWPHKWGHGWSHSLQWSARYRGPRHWPCLERARRSWPDLRYLLPQNSWAVSPDPGGGRTPCRGTVQTASRCQGLLPPAGQGALRLFLCSWWCHPGHPWPLQGGSTGRSWAAIRDGDWGTPLAGAGRLLRLLPGLDHHSEVGARGM